MDTSIALLITAKRCWREWPVHWFRALFSAYRTTTRIQNPSDFKKPTRIGKTRMDGLDCVYVDYSLAGIVDRERFDVDVARAFEEIGLPLEMSR